MKHVFEAAGFSENDFIVGIAPGAGASWGKDAKFKHWPAIKYAQLAEKLSLDLGAKIVILGDSSDMPIGEMIFGMMKNKPLDLTGKTSLGDFAAAIKNLNILVTNDGGPLHVAVALGINTVSLFGPVDDLTYGPYPASSKHVVIKKDLACRPCYKNFRMPLCQFDRECIKSIEVDDVFTMIRRMK
ncbi:MAG: glycosyltransferase family 9 protein [Candidatus Omnitrophica bacterium]|nr:glycosyltransferase family 9 protein [Candidatus Omnitrophota bacterium]